MGKGVTRLREENTSFASWGLYLRSRHKAGLKRERSGFRGGKARLSVSIREGLMPLLGPRVFKIRSSTRLLLHVHNSRKGLGGITPLIKRKEYKGKEKEALLKFCCIEVAKLPGRAVLISSKLQF